MSKIGFLVLFLFFKLGFVLAESITSHKRQYESQIKLQKEQICLNQYKEYFYSSQDVYDISKCNQKSKCLSEIHLEFTKCDIANDIHNNQIQFYQCIDNFLQNIGYCKHCICDLFSDFYLCSGGTIWQHQNS